MGSTFGIVDGEVSQMFWLLILDENGCIEGYDCEDDIYVLNTGESFPITTNTQDLLHLDGLYIYPNPVADYLNVVVDKPDLKYSIQNLNSQVMDAGLLIDRIDVRHLPSGVYFLQLQSGDELFQAQKFIKL